MGSCYYPQYTDEGTEDSRARIKWQEQSLSRQMEEPAFKSKFSHTHTLMSHSAFLPLWRYWTVFQFFHSDFSTQGGKSPPLHFLSYFYPLYIWFKKLTVIWDHCVLFSPHIQAQLTFICQSKASVSIEVIDNSPKVSIQALFLGLIFHLLAWTLKKKKKKWSSSRAPGVLWSFLWLL